MIGETIAHYRITGKLGEGGMGAVYRANDTKLNREVAIKVLPDEFASEPDRMARFTREAQVLASLNHPNIATIYGIEDHAIVMELVEGADLAGPLPLETALNYAGQIADALEAAHEKGITHRDLKPANIKITPQGVVKVLDFGLAKISEAPSAKPGPTATTRTSTQPGMVMGTAGYMAPEQARGQVVDKRADIWAFGVVLWEMLTGKQLFGGATASDAIAAVLTREPDLTLIPSRIRPLLTACLEKDPRKRLRDIGDWRRQITEPTIEPARHTKLSWVIAGIAAAVGLAVAVVHFRETPPPQSAPMRFQIPAPEKADFAEMGMAISPDGSRLAFIARRDGGQPMLWVRPLDSLEAHALAGTEGAIYVPFWSPDGRSIGFTTEGKLKRIEASGGPPQSLCQLAANLNGGSWSRDGAIIFGDYNGGLLQVPQSGGVPVRLTTTDESQGEFGHIMPWFLPDGRHFLYFSRNRRAEDQAIYLANLDSKDRKRLVSSRQAGAYAPPIVGSKYGHLLFLRESTLLALPLDTKRFEPAAEPFTVAGQVGFRLSRGLFSASANGVLVYRNSGSGTGRRLVWFDRQGKGLATFAAPGIGAGLRLSPDGKRVAMDAVDESGIRNIWLLDAERGVPARFTFGGGRDTCAIWSAHGALLVFGSDRNTLGTYEMYQKPAGGSGSELRLLKSGLSMLPNDWSSDMRYLLYGASGPKKASDLWVLPFNQGTPGEPMPYLQNSFNKRQGQFSPDGRWVVYTSDESGSYQVRVQSFPAGGGEFQVSAGFGVQPRWRRDGKEILYADSNGRIMAVEVKTSPKYEATGVPKALFDPHLPAGSLTDTTQHWDVSADGSRFVAANDTEGSAAPITVVLNWLAAVKH